MWTLDLEVTVSSVVLLINSGNGRSIKRFDFQIVQYMLSSVPLVSLIILLNLMDSISKYLPN